MTTNGTWASPVSTEGIEVELTEGGLWLEIHHPGGGEAKRSFLSAPELHRLADAPGRDGGAGAPAVQRADADRRAWPRGLTKIRGAGREAAEEWTRPAPTTRR